MVDQLCKITITTHVEITQYKLSGMFVEKLCISVHQKPYKCPNTLVVVIDK